MAWILANTGSGGSSINPVEKADEIGKGTGTGSVSYTKTFTVTESGKYMIIGIGEISVTNSYYYNGNSLSIKKNNTEIATGTGENVSTAGNQGLFTNRAIYFGDFVASDVISCSYSAATYSGYAITGKLELLIYKLN